MIDPEKRFCLLATQGQGSFIVGRYATAEEALRHVDHTASFAVRDMITGKWIFPKSPKSILEELRHEGNYHI